MKINSFKLLLGILYWSFCLPFSHSHAKQPDPEKNHKQNLYKDKEKEKEKKERPGKLEKTQDHLSLLSLPLFSLNRLNYKPFKTLNFNVILNKKNCEFKKSRPLDVYYINTEERLKPRIELSHNSGLYFGPTNIQFSNPHSFRFQFKAFNQFQGPNSFLQAFSFFNKKKNRCEVYTKIHYQKDSYILNNITLNFKLFLGFIKDIDFVQLTVQKFPKIPLEENGLQNLEKIILCPFGDCQHK